MTIVTARKTYLILAEYERKDIQLKYNTLCFVHESPENYLVTQSSVVQLQHFFDAQGKETGQSTAGYQKKAKALLEFTNHFSPQADLIKCADDLLLNVLAIQRSESIHWFGM